MSGTAPRRARRARRGRPPRRAGAAAATGSDGGAATADRGPHVPGPPSGAAVAGTARRSATSDPPRITRSSARSTVGIAPNGSNSWDRCGAGGGHGRPRVVPTSSSTSIGTIVSSSSAAEGSQSSGPSVSAPVPPGPGSAGGASPPEPASTSCSGSGVVGLVERDQQQFGRGVGAVRATGPVVDRTAGTHHATRRILGVAELLDRDVEQTARQQRQGVGTRQLLGGLDEAAAELGRRRAVVRLRPPGVFEHRGQRTEVGGDGHQPADPGRQRGDRRVGRRTAAIPVTASTMTRQSA